MFRVFPTRVKQRNVIDSHSFEFAETQNEEVRISMKAGKGHKGLPEFGARSRKAVENHSDKYFPEGTYPSNQVAVFHRVRKVIAVVKQRAYDDVLPKSDLSADLGFDILGKQALAPRLNTEFAKEGLSLSPAETGTATTVASLWWIVRKRLER